MNTDVGGGVGSVVHDGLRLIPHCPVGPIVDDAVGAAFQSCSSAVFRQHVVGKISANMAEHLQPMSLFPTFVLASRHSNDILSCITLPKTYGP